MSPLSGFFWVYQITKSRFRCTEKVKVDKNRYLIVCTHVRLKVGGLKQ